MVDVHCHLNFKAFANDYDQVIKDALKAGISTIINVGTKIDSSQKAVELAEKYENLYAIVGVHPHHADKLTEVHPEPIRQGQGKLREGPPDEWIKQLEQLAKHPKVVAIGECGMDYYQYKSNGIVDPKLQKDVFIKQIKLSHKLKLPLQIHNRHAGDDILKILKDHKSYLLDPPGMFHCFAGNMDLLKSALQMGFYIGFDGNITYSGLAPGETTTLSDLAKNTPIDRILTETDSPYLTPEPHRGSKNTPQYAIITGRFLAKLKNIPFEEFVAKTTQNANRLFQLNAKS